MLVFLIYMYCIYSDTWPAIHANWYYNSGLFWLFGMFTLGSLFVPCLLTWGIPAFGCPWAPYVLPVGLVSAKRFVSNFGSLLSWSSMVWMSYTCRNLIILYIALFVFNRLLLLFFSHLSRRMDKRLTHLFASWWNRHQFLWNMLRNNMYYLSTKADGIFFDGIYYPIQETIRVSNKYAIWSGHVI